MIKTNIDIQKDTKASTLHMTTNIIQVTDIKLEVWNYDYQWSCAYEVSKTCKHYLVLQTF